MENEDYDINIPGMGMDITRNYLELLDRNMREGDIVAQQPHMKQIQLPKTFKKVLLTKCSEIRDIKSVGYRESIVYNPDNFEPIKKFVVGVDIYFDDKKYFTKTKKEYNDIFNLHFKLTHSDMDFVTFEVQSVVLPPEKTNQEKFFELFGI